VEEIVKRKVDYEQIDGKHVFLTDTSEDPKAADLITALQAGYKWIKEGDKFKLANVQRIPAWFDYTLKSSRHPNRLNRNRLTLPILSSG